jgi:hypothetical protein
MFVLVHGHVALEEPWFEHGPANQPEARPRGWSCPHCAVENQRGDVDAGDVVECDYCGRAFAAVD